MEPLGPDYVDAEHPDSIAGLLGNIACRTLQVGKPRVCSASLVACGNLTLLVFASKSMVSSVLSSMLYSRTGRKCSATDV